MNNSPTNAAPTNAAPMNGAPINDAREREMRRPRFTLAAALIGAIAVPTVVLSLAEVSLSPAVSRTALLAALSAAAFTIAASAAAMAFVRWLLMHDARALSMSIALIVYAIATIGFADLVPLIEPDRFSHDHIALLRTAGSLSAVLWIALALGNVIRRPSAPRVAIGAAASIVGTTVLLSIPGVREIRLAGPHAGSVHESVVGTLVLLVGWLAIGTVCVTSGIRRHDTLRVWMGYTAVALAGASASFAGAHRDVEIIGGMLLTFVAMALALAGGIEQLRIAYVVKSGALRQARAEAHLAELARWAELAGEQERAHEARNALLGIQAAVLRLEHLCEEMGAEDMTALAGAMDREISRLRQLVEREPVRASSEFCRVDDVLVPVLMCHAAGDPIRWTIEPGMVTVPIADVLVGAVQNVLENARVHAPGARVSVTVSGVESHIQVRVEDDGPGIASGIVGHIFERGVTTRERAIAGTAGLGLHVARRELRACDGDLWLERSSPDGTVFVIEVPRVRAIPASAIGTGRP